MTDTVSDAITRIKNASLVKKQSVAVKNSKLVNEIAEILKNEGYIEGYRVDNASFTDLFPRQPLSKFQTCFSCRICQCPYTAMISLKIHPV